MSATLQFLTLHSYWVLFGAVLARQACLPVPANLVLVAAGAMAHSGRLSLSAAISLSVIGFLLADLVWYEAGRRFGHRILHFLCGFSRNPESCVHEGTSIFARHGVRTLLVSKFVVGLDAVAVPLAGTAGISPMRFLAFDGLGAALWSTTYAAAGYVFSDQLDDIGASISRMGGLVALSVAVAAGVYLLRRFAAWLHFVRLFGLDRITPEELSRKLNLGEDILVIDLQGHSGRAIEPLAIPGAIRIDPHKLERYKGVEIPPSREVVLYCSCPGEYTSARVALALRRRGVEHVRPLAGGLRAWRDRGFPVTSTFHIPPVATASG